MLMTHILWSSFGIEIQEKEVQMSFLMITNSSFGLILLKNFGKRNSVYFQASSGRPHPGSRGPPTSAGVTDEENIRESPDRGQYGVPWFSNLLHWVYFQNFWFSEEKKRLSFTISDLEEYVLSLCPYRPLCLNSIFEADNESSIMLKDNYESSGITDSTPSVDRVWPKSRL